MLKSYVQPSGRQYALTADACPDLELLSPGPWTEALQAERVDVSGKGENASFAVHIQAKPQRMENDLHITTEVQHPLAIFRTTIADKCGKNIQSDGLAAPHLHDQLHTGCTGVAQGGASTPGQHLHEIENSTRWTHWLVLNVVVWPSGIFLPEEHV